MDSPDALAAIRSGENSVDDTESRAAANRDGATRGAALDFVSARLARRLNREQRLEAPQLAVC